MHRNRLNFSVFHPFTTIRFSVIFIAFFLFSGQPRAIGSSIQELSTPDFITKTDTIENYIPLQYESRKLWMFESDGKWGIYDDALKGILVPAAYDAVLPTLIRDLYFFTDSTEVGVYDVQNQKELYRGTVRDLNIQLNESEELILVAGIEDYHYNTTSYFTEAYLIKDGQLMEVSRSRSPYANDFSPYDDRPLYKNKIALLDNNIIAHGYTFIDWSSVTDMMNGEEQIKYLLKRNIQHDSYLSLKDMSFIIPPVYVQIDDRGDYYSGVNVRELPEGSKNKQDFFTFSALDKNFNTIISSSKRELLPVKYGGFYSSMMNAEDSISIYNTQGAFLTKLKTDQPIYTAWQLRDYIILGIYSGGMLTEMGLSSPHIYDLQGNLLKKETFGLEDIDPNSNTAMISIERSESPPFFYNGIYDLKKLKMAIQPEYDWIKLMPYASTLIPCSDSVNCKSLYIGSKSDEIFLFSTAFQPIDYKAEYEDVYLLSKTTHDGYTHPKVTPVKPDEADFKQFELRNLAIKYKVTGIFSKDDGDEEYQGGWGEEQATEDRWAVVSDEYEDLEVLAIYEKADQPPVFGLREKGSSDFLLKPIFTSMEFNHTTHTLELRWGEKSRSLSLVRFETE